MIDIHSYLKLNLKKTPNKNAIYFLITEEKNCRYLSGGICQTFPVNASPLGGCRNLEEMLEYLEETDNFDMAWEILSKYHRKLFDINKFDIIQDPDAFGFNDEIKG